MYEEQFVKRLVALRMARGVSARDMSLSLGQNPGYIHNIESGRALPSMTVFFYICEYLGVTPSDFFDFDAPRSRAEDAALADSLRRLTPPQFDAIATLVRELTRSAH